MAIAVCTCGRYYNFEDDLIGRSVRCPQCGSTIAVVNEDAARFPTEDDWEPTNPSAPVPVNRSAFYQQPSQRKFKKSSAGLVVAMISLVVLIVGTAIGIFSYSYYSSLARLPAPENGVDALTFQEEEGATADFAAWYEYKSPTGGFSIHFPERPEVRVTASGNQALVNAGGGVLWSVVYYDTRPSDPDMKGGPQAHLDRQAAVSAKKASLMTYEKEQILGCAARQYLLEKEGEIRYVRTLFRNSRVYYITWSGPKEQAHPLDVRAFFESFTFN